MNKIVVEEYNPQWAIEFEKLKEVYLKHLKHLDVDVQHVGSTSVPGLAAKPIIDMDIITDKEENVEIIINTLSNLGYIHLGEMGIKGRQAFKRASSEVPYDDNVSLWCQHHLYVCVRGCASLENHLKLREYLKKNPEAALEYGNLKKRLSKKHEYDIDTYVEEKTPFITRILSLSGMSTDDIGDISIQNKKS